MQDVPYHIYDSVIVSAPGFDVRTFSDVTVAGTTELSTQLERDWAALSGGATIEAFDGSSQFGDCSVNEAFDGDEHTAWVARAAHARRSSRSDSHRPSTSADRPQPHRMSAVRGLQRFTIFTGPHTGSGSG